MLPNPWLVTPMDDVTPLTCCPPWMMLPPPLGMCYLPSQDVLPLWLVTPPPFLGGDGGSDVPWPVWFKPLIPTVDHNRSVAEWNRSKSQELGNTIPRNQTGFNVASHAGEADGDVGKGEVTPWIVSWLPLKNVTPMDVTPSDLSRHGFHPSL